MEVVDRIRWIPSFGYERELDWLLNMHDWMISKKRYWGLALPIYDCRKCGSFDVIGGREELQRAGDRGLGRVRGPHAAPAVRGRGDDRVLVVRRARVAHPGCRQPVAGRGDRAVLDAPLPRGPRVLEAVVPGRLHHRELSRPVPQLVLLDARDVDGPQADRAVPTIFGYALVFGEDGRPMHKSWGNAIEFDEAAERMGVDVMRWMFAKARPEDNINFGWHAADEARRELLILWNVYAFFVTYARLAGWVPRRGIDEEVAAADRGRCSTAGSSRARPGSAAEVGDQLNDYDAVAATRALSAFIDDLSTWYLRRSRDRMRQGADPADQAAAFATLHAALVVLSRTLAPILPFLSEGMYQNLIVSVVPSLPDSVHLTAWPAAEDRAVPRRAAGTGDGHSPRGRRAGADAARPGGHPRAAAAWPSMDRRPGARSRARRRAARPVRRGDQRQGRRGDRRRIGARRAAGEAAPAEDRQAARVRRSPR